MRDIVVIGASAGGVRALRTLVAGLPADVAASFFVTIHVTPHAPSLLPELLSRGGPLPAKHPANEERVQRGRIYVAPPDRHLLLRRGRIELSHGPRENGARPSVDPMFRSAAREFGARVIGVVLSGSLDDGTAGLRAVKARGGVAVAQSPETAAVPEMPRNAIADGIVDHVVPLDQLAERLVELIRLPAPTAAIGTSTLEAEAQLAKVSRGIAYGWQPGVPSDFSCPDCGGVLRFVPDETSGHLRCHVGHAWNQQALLAAQVERVEESLWAALRSLEEHAKLTRRVRDDFRHRGHPQLVANMDEKLGEIEHHAAEIRKLLVRPAGVATAVGTADAAK